MHTSLLALKEAGCHVVSCPIEISAGQGTEDGPRDNGWQKLSPIPATLKEMNPAKDNVHELEVDLLEQRVETAAFEGT